MPFTGGSCRYFIPKRIGENKFYRIMDFPKDYITDYDIIENVFTFNGSYPYVNVKTRLEELTFEKERLRATTSSSPVRYRIREEDIPSHIKRCVLEYKSNVDAYNNHETPKILDCDLDNFFNKIKIGEIPLIKHPTETIGQWWEGGKFTPLRLCNELGEDSNYVEITDTLRKSTLLKTRMIGDNEYTLYKTDTGHLLIRRDFFDDGSEEEYVSFIEEKQLVTVEQYFK